MNANDYTAVVLLAGYGSRISDVINEPKSLLEIGDESILSRHLRVFIETGIKRVVLVVGYKKELIVNVAEQFADQMEITFIENNDFLKTGNGISLQMGIEVATGPVLIFDGDLVYARDILERFIAGTDPSAFLVGKASLDDIECTKILIDDQEIIRRNVDKRAVTAGELEQFQFAGEAMGILKFSDSDRQDLLRLCHKFYSRDDRMLLNWEHLMTQFFPTHELRCHFDDSEAWIEIDTREDYDAAKGKIELLNKLTA
ncbi:MAG: phosphocholine cytidylyltransferase family protein [Verrucomicrobiia bacterium]|jgi:choline kinase